jgi:PBP1b-binding outer membrane lipoprotein LpoB
MEMSKVMSTALSALCAGAFLVGCSQERNAPATTSNTNTAPQAQTAPKEEAVSTAKEETTGGVHEGTISGAISDSMCGKDHMKMGDMGKDAELCSHKCVEAGAKYVLVADNGEVYQLSDQKRAKEFAGKSVQISGHIDETSKAIHLHGISGQ